MTKKVKQREHSWWDIFFIRIYSPADLFLMFLVYIIITESESFINVIFIIIISFMWILTQSRIRRKFDIDDPLKVK